MTTKPPAEMKTAGDIMATRLTTVSPQTDVATAIGMLVKHNVSGMPVLDEQGQYLGVFSEKSCLRALTQTAAALQQNGDPVARASDFMVTRLFRLTPQEHVFDAIGALLKHRVSGAPVVDTDGLLLGVFSEKDSMSVLIKAAYEQLPGADVSAFMNPDRGRFISEDTDLLTIAKMFVDSSYRRLAVVRDGMLQGQISRRDVLRNSRLLASILKSIVHVADDQGPIAEPVASEHSEAAQQRLSATSVAQLMDTAAKTISEDVDLLTIAQTFLSTPYRRLPVIGDGRLLGQVSRRDVLDAVYRLIAPHAADRQLSVLYLSGVLRDGDAVPRIQ
jgi:CBS domain-containing protein